MAEAVEGDVLAIVIVYFQVTFRVRDPAGAVLPAEGALACAGGKFVSLAVCVYCELYVAAMTVTAYRVFVCHLYILYWLLLAMYLFLIFFLEVAAAAFDFPIAVAGGFFQAGIFESTDFFFLRFCRIFCRRGAFGLFLVLGAWFFVAHIP